MKNAEQLRCCFALPPLLCAPTTFAGALSPVRPKRKQRTTIGFLAKTFKVNDSSDRVLKIFLFRGGDKEGCRKKTWRLKNLVMGANAFLPLPFPTTKTRPPTGQQ